MPKIRVDNGTTDVVCLLVEPWGTDHWMLPGEAFTVITAAEPVETPFDVAVHDQGVSVYVNAGYDAQVIDGNGRPAPCGHQRPA